jgi:hypothetical protein
LAIPREWDPGAAPWRPASTLRVIVLIVHPLRREERRLAHHVRWSDPHADRRKRKKEKNMSESLSRGQIQDLLFQFSKKTPSYRAALIKNPRAVVEGQMGAKIPASITVKAVEETADTMYVVVPYVAASGAELSDSALEMVAGGKNDSYDCHSAIGGMNTRVEFNASIALG